MSEEAEWIIKRREEAIQEKDYQLYLDLTRVYNRQKKQDRRKYFQNLVDKDWDERSNWMGVRIR